ncbi:DMT family transporter [Marinicella sp. W31]|uniref:DMT family transporter n=1 Tax=Marinicella sp. W31 TaxID=3023713 RepID=UPI00375727C2
MNNTQSNWKIGLTLSLITVLFWSTLPISLKIGLDAMDAWSLTWLRFLAAAVFTFFLLLFRKRLNQFKQLNRTQWLWLTIAAVMLVGNYLFFLYGLEQTSPANAQVLIQMAPLLMTLGGVLIFKEHFSRIQMFGASLILIGLVLFFNEQIQLMLADTYWLGFLMMFTAALTWAIYALIQKHLSSVLSSQAILLFIYVFASITLLFNVKTDAFNGLTDIEWTAIIYACLNTIGAYAAFAEAIKQWQASRVGMVLAITPVVTLFFINLFASLFPELLNKENIQSIGWIGIIAIVSGSMLASMKNQRKKDKK